MLLVCVRTPVSYVLPSSLLHCFLHNLLLALPLFSYYRNGNAHFSIRFSQTQEKMLRAKCLWFSDLANQPHSTHIPLPLWPSYPMRGAQHNGLKIKLVPLVYCTAPLHHLPTRGTHESESCPSCRTSKPQEILRQLPSSKTSSRTLTSPPPPPSFCLFDKGCPAVTCPFVTVLNCQPTLVLHPITIWPHHCLLQTSITLC